MIRLLNWLSVLQFLSVPALIIASIWNGELKLTFIAIVLLLSAAFTNSLGQTILKQSVPNI